MKRRTLIRAVAAGGIGGITGCVGSKPGGDGSTDGSTESPTEEPTDTPTGTATPGSTPTSSPGPPRLTGQSFEVIYEECGNGTDRASVEWGDRTVTVTGIISGSNGCYTAELGRAKYDADADELRVDVRSYEPEDASNCTMCIVDIDYRSELEFEGGTPETVSVRHNGDSVERATADGS